MANRGNWLPYPAEHLLNGDVRLSCPHRANMVMQAERTRWINSESQRKVGLPSAIGAGDKRVYQDLLLLLEHILEDQRTPDRAACVHECTAFAELAQLYGSESELIR